MNKITQGRTLGRLLYCHTQRCRSSRNGRVVHYCSQPSNGDDESKTSRLMAALKGLKVEKNIGRKIEKKTSMNQNLDMGSSKKPHVLEALRQAVSSLPEPEKAEEELLIELQKQDAQTLEAKQISQRPDRLHSFEEYKTESDLLKRLRTPNQPEEETNILNSLVSELRVQQPKESTEHETRKPQNENFKKVFVSQLNGERSEMNDFKKSSQTLPYKRQRKRSLFERHRLNIFEASSRDEIVPAKIGSSIWELEEQRTLQLLKYDSISNGFDEMSRLTEEGKVWQYPINNEQGMESEMEVGFHEHIFLERHLEAFPTKGPVRHFMELVIHGLSMNPYITVQQKKDNIQWFQDYFKNKESILKETGAIEQEFSFQ